MKNISVLNELKNKTVLITGGAGSVGSELTKKILDFPVKQVRVIDVNEHSLFLLGRKLNNHPKLRLFLGNILDKDRLEMACGDVDIIIHLAAVKNLEVTEFNPIETIDTNINGLVNLIKITRKSKIKKFLNISTDKAADAVTLYGSTKLLSEKLTSWAGLHLNPPTKFATARFGNIIESKGNVFEVWENQIKENKAISITDSSMNRYFFHIEEAVEFILNCLPLIDKGEIFVPKMKKFNIKELANKYSKNQFIIGLRKGEKIEEILMTKEEEKIAKQKKNMWIIKQSFTKK
jgi:UDP-N-acetylglucosamine 4,6-dehydratase/5-epimerase